MIEPVTQTAAIVAVIAVILDKTLPWIAKARNGGVSKDQITAQKPLMDKLESLEEDLKIVDRRVEDLHDWHAKEDADGVKVWYIRHSLEEAVSRIGESIDRQTKVLEALTHSQELMLNHLERGQQQIMDEIRRPR